MQPIQDVVEQLVEWNLTAKATLGLTQIRRKVFRELVFRYFRGYVAHGGTSLRSGQPDVKMALIMRTDQRPVNGLQTLKFAHHAIV